MAPTVPIVPTVPATVLILPTVSIVPSVPTVAITALMYLGNSTCISKYLYLYFVTFIWRNNQDWLTTKTQHFVGFRKNAIVMIIPLKIITDNYYQITLG